MTTQEPEQTRRPWRRRFGVALLVALGLGGCVGPGLEPPGSGNSDGVGVPGTAGSAAAAGTGAKGDAGTSLGGAGSNAASAGSGGLPADGGVAPTDAGLDEDAGTTP
jgi:hypothetical protein